MNIESTPELAEVFRMRCIAEMQLNVTRLQKTLPLLTEAELWERPNAASNSIGNLMLHLAGNIEQWIVSALGGATDVRDRNAEFAAKGGATPMALLARLEAVIDTACMVMGRTTTDDLLAIYTVQGFSYSGVGVMLHAVEHLSYHVGQIAFWTKALKGQDLGFYADHKGLNSHNRRSLE